MPAGGEIVSMNPIPASTGALMRDAKFTVSKYKSRLHHRRIVRSPVGITRLAAVKVAIAVGPRGHADKDRADLLRSKASEREALLAAHAAAHQHDGLTVPVASREQVIERARVAQVHVQEVRRLAVGITEFTIVAGHIPRRVRRQFVMRVDVENQPPFGCTRGRSHRRSRYTRRRTAVGSRQETCPLSPAWRRSRAPSSRAPPVRTGASRRRAHRSASASEPG